MSKERLWKDINRLKRLTNGELSPFHQDIEDVLSKLDLYKSVLNEVREYEESSSFEVDTRDYGRLTVCDADELALILDKVGGSNES